VHSSFDISILFSSVDVWEPQYAPNRYNIEGGLTQPCICPKEVLLVIFFCLTELVLAVPNDADGRVMNAHSIEGNIALVYRGKVLHSVLLYAYVIVT
jgi:hypothetical protein